MSFAAEISAWAEAEKERHEAVFQEAVQTVVREVLETGPSVASTGHAISAGLGSTGRGKNRKHVQGPVNRSGTGRLPVDTGNLRRSLMASTSAMPAIQEGKTNFVESDIELIIAGAQLGSTVYLGFQAAYAARMEFGFVGTDSLGRLYNQTGYGFVSAVAQRWSQIVQQADAKVQTRFESGGQ